MYFGWLHKKIPENCSIKILKKSFLVPFRVLIYFSTSRNDRVFLFPRALKKTYIGMDLCNLIYYTRKHPKIEVSKSSKKVFWVCFGFLNIFQTTRNGRIFLFPRALKKTHISMNSCIMVDYTWKHPKVEVSKSSKKVFLVRFEFWKYFRLLETTEFFFSLGLLKRLISAWT